MGEETEKEPPPGSPTCLNIFAEDAPEALHLPVGLSKLQRSSTIPRQRSVILFSFYFPVCCSRMFFCFVLFLGGGTNGKWVTAKGLKGEKEERQEVTMHSCWVPGPLLSTPRSEGLIYVTTINLTNGNTHLVVGYAATHLKSAH